MSIARELIKVHPYDGKLRSYKKNEQSPVRMRGGNIVLHKTKE